MNRVTILLDDEMLAWLENAVKECGCGSKSAHIRHVLKLSGEFGPMKWERKES